MYNKTKQTKKLKMKPYQFERLRTLVQYLIEHKIEENDEIVNAVKVLFEMKEISMWKTIENIHHKLNENGIQAIGINAYDYLFSSNHIYNMLKMKNIL